jgi:hypothetical protein
MVALRFGPAIPNIGEEVSILLVERKGFKDIVTRLSSKMEAM